MQTKVLFVDILELKDPKWKISQNLIFGWREELENHTKRSMKEKKGKDKRERDAGYEKLIDRDISRLGETLVKEPGHAQLIHQILATRAVL